MARPTKRTRERVDAALLALRLGNTRAAAAAAIEVGVSTFREWIAELPWLAAAVEQAEREAELVFAERIRKAAAEAEIIETWDRDGNLVRSVTKFDWKAAAWWLERRHPADWRPIAAVEISGPDGKPVETHDVVDWRPDAAWMERYARVAAEVGPDADDTEADPSDEVQPA